MQSFNQNVIKHKLGLLNLASELGNVSKACKVMGLSRDTFYRYQAAVESDGVEALFEQNRRKPNLKNRIDEATSWLDAKTRHALYHISQLQNAIDLAVPARGDALRQALRAEDSKPARRFIVGDSIRRASISAAHCAGWGWYRQHAAQ